MKSACGDEINYAKGRLLSNFLLYQVSVDIHVHDLNATILHLLGLDHKRLTYKYQGRNFRLMDVHGDIVKQVLA